jgi:hypothetical protein
MCAPSGTCCIAIVWAVHSQIVGPEKSLYDREGNKRAAVLTHLKIVRLERPACTEYD